MIQCYYYMEYNYIMHVLLYLLSNFNRIHVSTYFVVKEVLVGREVSHLTGELGEVCHWTVYCKQQCSCTVELTLILCTLTSTTHILLIL